MGGGVSLAGRWRGVKSAGKVRRCATHSRYTFLRVTHRTCLHSDTSSTRVAADPVCHTKNKYVFAGDIRGSSSLRVWSAVLMYVSGGRCRPALASAGIEDVPSAQLWGCFRACDNSTESDVVDGAHPQRNVRDRANPGDVDKYFAVVFLSTATARREAVLSFGGARGYHIMRRTHAARTHKLYC